MYLHDIGSDQEFEITLHDGRVVYGNFEGKIDHMNFHMSCTEISKEIESLINTQTKMKFNVGASDYTFTAQIMQKSERKSGLNESIHIKILTAFKEIPLRAEPRIALTTKIKSYAYVDDFKQKFAGEMICEGTTVDVSKNGIRIWADHCLPEIPDSLFTLEITLPPGRTHFIPMKLKRHKRNTETRSYAYDYGFVFDFTNVPEKKDMLFLNIMEAKLQGRL